MKGDAVRRTMARLVTAPLALAVALAWAVARGLTTMHMWVTAALLPRLEVEEYMAPVQVVYLLPPPTSPRRALPAPRLTEKR
jgi:hypothetical protein